MALHSSETKVVRFQGHEGSGDSIEGVLQASQASLGESQGASQGAPHAPQGAPQGASKTASQEFSQSASGASSSVSQSTQNTQSALSASPDAQDASPESQNASPAANAQTPVPCLYNLGRELGAGSYAVVHEVRHTLSGKKYAAKIVNKNLMRGREHLIKNEIAILERVSRGHPNVLTLIDYFETKESLYLVTEVARGGELFDRICERGAYGESDSQWLMRQLVSGVAHLHRNGIVHRDLKLENLLFQSHDPRARLLICDFGLSKIIDDGKHRMLTTTVGTPSYMAPEVLTKKGHGKPVDVWALGVIAYVILSGFQPFDRDSDQEEREAIEHCDLKFEPEKFWVHITSDAQNFIKQCLKINPEERPTAEALLASRFLTRKYRSAPFGISDDSSSFSDEEYAALAQNSKTQASEHHEKTMNGAFSLPPEKEKFQNFFAWR